MLKKLSKDKVKEWLNSLSESNRVLAPVDRGGAVIFASYTGGEELKLNSFAVNSPKEALFPSSERMFSYSYDKTEDETNINIETPVDGQKSIVFGARPCDARGVSIFDAVYAGKGYQDPYFKAKQESTTWVVTGCNDPDNACFCTSVGGNPYDTTGADVLLTDMGEGYLVEGLTEKGNLLLNHAVFEDVNNQEEKNIEEIKSKATKGVKTAFQLEGIIERLKDSFGSGYWQKESDRCLSCGICTFVCPTCYCFNITDDDCESGGERIRSWDACMSSMFTLEASGHNPRANKSQRLRQRINHKFNYHPAKYGMFGCMGCGRCVRHCPVSIDIRKIINEVSNV
ncbi:MAG: 4Fe-4S dicluster domain-containing protein [Thermodesulfobacteriota bacterium]